MSQLRISGKFLSTMMAILAIGSYTPYSFMKDKPSTNLVDAKKKVF